MDRIENVIIIGSGPAGYTAALYTARANLEPLVIEGFAWGGLLQQTTEVENYPGFRDGIMGPELMQTMRDQAERFGARFITDLATGVELSGEPGGVHRVWVDEDELHEARTVVLAMGAEHKKLGVPGEDELGGRGVSYCATCDAAFFRDAQTVIVGGGDSAMEEALFLTRFASTVTIVHRRDEFRASKIMLDRARAHEKIKWLTNVHITEVLDVNKSEVTGVRLQTAKNGAHPPKTWEMPISAVFLGIGHEPNTRIFRGQLATDADGYLLTKDYVFTQVPGVYACGDVQDRRYRQAITAAGSGCMAAMEAERFLQHSE